MAIRDPLPGGLARLTAEVHPDDSIAHGRRWRGERDRYRAALEAIRDHGKTHDQPCWAISNGDCADVMQEIARAALDA